LAHQKPGCNPAATRLQPGCSDAETHVYPRARAGAVKDLPITSTSTSSAGAREPASEIAAAPEVAEEEEEVTFQKLIAICRSVQMPMPDRFREAIQTARASGCSFRQLAGRCQWFHRHWAEWPSSHRKGAIYYGLKNATPDMPANAGWPYR
jgi:hypothetical protein